MWALCPTRRTDCRKLMIARNFHKREFLTCGLGILMPEHCYFGACEFVTAISSCRALRFGAHASSPLRERRRFLLQVFGCAQPCLPDCRVAGTLGELAIPRGEIAKLLCLDELRRCGLVGMNHYGRDLITQSAPHRVRALGQLSRNRRDSAPWAPRSARSPRQFLRSP